MRSNCRPYALWRLNYIHPFVNGNGRTARAICFFVLCAKYKRLFKGPQSLPQLLRNQEYRQRYCDGLADADTGNLTPLQTLVGELFLIQVRQQGRKVDRWNELPQSRAPKGGLLNWLAILAIR